MRDSPLLFPNRTGGLYSRVCLWNAFRHVRAQIDLEKKITPRGMRRTSKDLSRLAGASQVVAMAINGHHTEQMHNHYSTVHEVEIREVLEERSALARWVLYRFRMMPGKAPTAQTLVASAPATALR